MGAIGRDRMSVFGNSAGRKVAFQLAVSFPEVPDQ
jgi:hypothetical protein